MNFSSIWQFYLNWNRHCTLSIYQCKCIKYALINIFRLWCTFFFCSQPKPFVSSFRSYLRIFGQESKWKKTRLWYGTKLKFYWKFDLFNMAHSFVCDPHQCEGWLQRIYLRNSADWFDIENARCSLIVTEKTNIPKMNFQWTSNP